MGNILPDRLRLLERALNNIYKGKRIQKVDGDPYLVVDIRVISDSPLGPDVFVVIKHAQQEDNRKRTTVLSIREAARITGVSELYFGDEEEYAAMMQEQALRGELRKRYVGTYFRYLSATALIVEIHCLSSRSSKYRMVRVIMKEVHDRAAEISRETIDREICRVANVSTTDVWFNWVKC